jgi:hypothetical protein
MQKIEIPFRRKRVGLYGDNSLHSDDPAATFCRAVGRCLALSTGVVMVQGGRGEHRKKRGTSAADRFFVAGAKASLPSSEWNERIETMLFEGAEEPARNESVREGRVVSPNRPTREANRYAFVGGVDAVLTVKGDSGTETVLELCATLEKPVLPVPTFGGTSAKFWEEPSNKAWLADVLRLPDDHESRWMTLGNKQIDKMADEMVSVLLGCFRKQCFVAMPYHTDFDPLYQSVIQPAIEKTFDHRALRLDRKTFFGNIHGAIGSGVANCDYLLAVLNGYNRNVLFEVGAAMALGKPCLLIVGDAPLEPEVTTQEPPFDIQAERQLRYTRGDFGDEESFHTGLRKLLETEISALLSG